MKVKISEIKENSSNPRIIRNDKFEKLKESIKNFPEMMEIRPIVLDEKYMVIGGNMRFAACQELGWEEVPVIIAKLSEEQTKQFIIKDNVSFGDWDWDDLGDAEKWNANELESYGIEVWTFEEDFDETEKTEMPEVEPERVDRAEYLEVICPNCAHEFSVKI